MDRSGRPTDRPVSRGGRGICALRHSPRRVRIPVRPFTCMQPTTESRLLTAMRRGNATAYTAFVTGHLGLVYAQAQRIARGDPGDLCDELTSEGRLVLCAEAQAFAAQSYPCRFSTYLTTRLRRALVSFRRRQDLIGATEWRARNQQRTRELRDTLRRDLGWCDRCQQEMPADEVTGLCRACGGPLQAYEPSTDDLAYVGGVSSAVERPGFVPVSDGMAAPADETDGWQQRVSEAFLRLPRAQRELLSVCFELMEGTGNVSRMEVARRCHVSRQEVVQALYAFAAHA